MKVSNLFLLKIILSCGWLLSSTAVQASRDTLTARQILEQYPQLFQAQEKILWVQEDPKALSRIQYLPDSSQTQTGIISTSSHGKLAVKLNAEQDGYTLAKAIDQNSFDLWIKAYFPDLLLKSATETVANKYDEFVLDDEAWSSSKIMEQLNPSITSVTIQENAVPWKAMNLRDFLTTAIVLSLQDHNNSLLISNSKLQYIPLVPLAKRDEQGHQLGLFRYRPNTSIVVGEAAPAGFSYPDWVVFLLGGLFIFSVAGLLWFYYFFRRADVQAYREVVQLLRKDKKYPEARKLNNSTDTLVYLKKRLGETSALSKQKNGQAEKKDLLANPINKKILDQVTSFTALDSSKVKVDDIQKLLKGIGVKNAVVNLLQQKTPSNGRSRSNKNNLSDQLNRITGEVQEVLPALTAFYEQHHPRAKKITPQVNRLLSAQNDLEKILHYFKSKNSSHFLQQLTKLKKSSRPAQFDSTLEELFSSHFMIKKIQKCLKNNSSQHFLENLEAIITQPNPGIKEGISLLQLFNFQEEKFIQDISKRYHLAVTLQEQAKNIPTVPKDQLEWIQSVTAGLQVLQHLHPPLTQSDLSGRATTQLADYYLLQELIQIHTNRAYLDTMAQKIDTLKTRGIPFSPLSKNPTFNWVEEKINQQFNTEDQSQFLVNLYQRYRDFTHDLESKNVAKKEDLAWIATHLIEMFFTTIDFLAHNKVVKAPLNVRLYAGANYQSILEDTALLESIKNWKASRQLKGEADAFLPNLIDFARHLHVGNLDRVLVHGYHIPEEVLKTGNGTLTRYTNA